MKKIQSALNQQAKKFQPKEGKKIVYVQPKNGVYQQPKKQS